MADAKPYYVPREQEGKPSGKGAGFWLGCAGVGCAGVLLVGLLLGLVVWRTVGTHIQSGMNLAKMITAVEQEKLDLQQLDRDFPLDEQNPPPVDEALIERYRAARTELSAAFGTVLQDWMQLAESFDGQDFSKDKLQQFNDVADRTLPLIDKVAAILRRYSIGPAQYRHVAGQGWLRLAERAAEPGSPERRGFEDWLAKMRPLMNEGQAGQSPEQMLEEFRAEMRQELERLDDPLTEQTIRENWALWGQAELADFAVDQAIIFLNRDLMVEQAAQGPGQAPPTPANGP